METVWIARSNGIPESGYDIFRHEPQFDCNGYYKGNNGGYCNLGILPFIRISKEEFEKRWSKLKIKQGEKGKVAMLQGITLEFFK